MTTLTITQLGRSMYDYQIKYSLYPHKTVYLSGLIKHVVTYVSM
jgi:hypothetical protein